MKKFMVLYMASAPDFEKMMKSSTPEQQKKGMEDWMRWMNANKTSIVEGGGPLGKTKRVDTNGTSDTKNGSEVIRSCKPKRMMVLRRYLAKTIHIYKCPAHG